MDPAKGTTSRGCPEEVQDPSRHPARKNLFSPHLITTRRCGWTSPEGDVPMSPSPAPHYKRGLTTTLQDHLGRSGYPGIAILYPRPRDVAHQPIIYEATVCQPKQNSGRRYNGRVIFPWMTPITRFSFRSIFFKNSVDGYFWGAPRLIRWLQRRQCYQDGRIFLGEDRR